MPLTRRPRRGGALGQFGGAGPDVGQHGLAAPVPPGRDDHRLQQAQLGRVEQPERHLGAAHVDPDGRVPGSPVDGRQAQPAEHHASRPDRPGRPARRRLRRASRGASCTRGASCSPPLAPARLVGLSGWRVGGRVADEVGGGSGAEAADLVLLIGRDEEPVAGGQLVPAPAPPGQPQRQPARQHVSAGVAPMADPAAPPRPADLAPARGQLRRAGDDAGQHAVPVAVQPPVIAVGPDHASRGASAGRARPGMTVPSSESSAYRLTGRRGCCCA